MTTINTCPQDPAPAAPSRGSASTLNLALGYGRVSTAKQGLSREAQTETVQRAAAFYTVGNSGTDAVSEMFFDDDTSGSIPFVDRPAGRQLLARVRDALAAGLSPTIIVTKVDRLGRDTVDVSQTVTLFESLGLRLRTSETLWFEANRAAVETFSEAWFLLACKPGRGRRLTLARLKVWRR
jgi:hypothetical protein